MRRDRVGEKPYSLLYAALRKTGYVALAQMRHRQFMKARAL